MSFPKVKQMATTTKSIKKNQVKLELYKETLVRTTGIEYDMIAANDEGIEGKLMKYVDKIDLEDPRVKTLRYIDL